MTQPYRVVPESTPCPRCKGRLAEILVVGRVVLDCTQCGGLFVDTATMDEVGLAENAELRHAFPRRPRAIEPEVVCYLQCPVCDSRMNRVNFGRTTGVIVDVCKPHGVWFDTGEIDPILDFIDGGGLDRLKAKQKVQHDEENERLRAEWRVQHEASERATTWGRKQLYLSHDERAALGAFFSWFRS